MHCCVCQILFNSESKIVAANCGHEYHHSCLFDRLDINKRCNDCDNLIHRSQVRRIYYNFNYTWEEKQFINQELLAYTNHKLHFLKKVCVSKIKKIVKRLYQICQLRKYLKVHSKKKKYYKLLLMRKKEVDYYKKQVIQTWELRELYKWEVFILQQLTSNS